MLYIDQNAAIIEVKMKMVEVLEEASEIYMEIIASKLDGGPPGRTEWQENLGQDLKIVERDVATTILTYKISTDYIYNFRGFGDYEVMRAFLINYGSGSRGLTGIAIHTRPGELVWDNDLFEIHPSNAKTEYNLPDGFNQAGSYVFEEAYREFKPQFAAMVERAWNSINWGKFLKNDGK
jgi:hypothetical protein